MSTTLYPKNVTGHITMVASKSQTIRALLIATFAKGKSIIHNALESDDTFACITVCRAFGATITVLADNSLLVQAPQTFPDSIAVDCGNSGTTLYLATGLAASIACPVTFTGDEQLQNRPLGELLRALTELGVAVEALRPGYPPFTIRGPITGGTTTIECHSSQYLSALLLGCPLGTNKSTIYVPLLNERPYVKMTTSWLDNQGIAYESSPQMDKFSIAGQQTYLPFGTTIWGDYSSASFFFCSAAVTGGCVTVSGLDPDDSQGDKEILPVLEAMGCTVTWTDTTSVRVCGPKKGSLQSGVFDLNAMPDALPVLAVTACYAQGKTMLTNVPQARIKETDRITSMRKNLVALGARVEEEEDALVIYGNGELPGGPCKGFGDHRIIMAMAIAALGAKNPVTIDSTAAVAVTFPTFFSLLEQISEEIVHA